MVISDRITPQGRNDGRGGKAKGAAKRQAGKPKAAAKAKKAAIKTKAKAAPFEESDGFQIFRAAPGAAKRKKKAVADNVAPKPAESAPEREPETTPETARPAEIPQSDIGRMMAGAIRSIVEDEMQRSIDRITRSVVQETLAKEDRGK